MDMNEIEFDIRKLSKKERQAYESMTEKERKGFENAWVKYNQIRMDMDNKIIKSNHRAALKENREKEAKRKQATHRKIVNGGILESYLPDELKQLDDDDKNSNTALHEFLNYVFRLPQVNSKILESENVSYFL